MSTVALSKLGMLYIQDGMASDDKQIVDPSWIKRSFTIGDDTVEDKGDLFGYIGWWLGTDPAVGTYGFGGQRLAMNLENHRVVAILSETYYKDAGVAEYDDPTKGYPTDQIKEWAFEATTPAKESKSALVCATKPSVAPEDPSAQDPVDPGTADPGTADPGTADPGTADPGTADPGTADPGTADPEPLAQDPADSGSSRIESSSALILAALVVLTLLR